MANNNAKLQLLIPVLYYYYDIHVDVVCVLLLITW